jgi:hypothetical protein
MEIVEGCHGKSSPSFDQIVYGAHNFKLRGESLSRRVNVNRDSLYKRTQYLSITGKNG